MLFRGLFSWWAMPEVSTPREASFFSCRSWLCLRSSSTIMWLKASTTPRVSSLVSGRGKASKLPCTIWRAECSMTPRAPKMRRPTSQEKNAATPVKTAMASTSWCLRVATMPRILARWVATKRWTRSTRSLPWSRRCGSDAEAWVMACALPSVLNPAKVSL
ncbi:hypothetical protein DSECCO2_338740 [anaerobic digester metagenome]